MKVFAKSKGEVNLTKRDFVASGGEGEIYRKARTAGISSRWVRGYAEVLGTPGWNFVEEVFIHGVMYVHGENGTASKKMTNEHCSVVQGHLHSQGYVQWSVGAEHRLFGMQVGCGVDRHAYAMSYGKMGPKPVISCGVVLDKGFLPIVIPMKLILNGMGPKLVIY